MSENLRSNIIYSPNETSQWLPVNTSWTVYTHNVQSLMNVANDSYSADMCMKFFIKGKSIWGLVTAGDIVEDERDSPQLGWLNTAALWQDVSPLTSGGYPLKALVGLFFAICQAICELIQSFFASLAKYKRWPDGIYEVFII